MTGVCVECGAGLTGNQTMYCSTTCKKRWWRRDEERRERDREISRRWKRTHPEETRAYDRERHQRMKVPCPGCGEPVKPSTALCRACCVRRAAERVDQAARLWAAGRSIKEIASVLDTTPGATQVLIHRARAEDPARFPRRYKARRRKAAA